jgi:FkbH-like protein
MKLIEALRTIESEKRLDSNLLEIALVCGFTPLHLQTFLHAQLLQLFPEHRVDIHTGLFGDIPGSLKRLQEQPVTAVALVLEWQDLDARLGIRQLGGWSPRTLEDISGQVQLRLSQLRFLIENLNRSVSLVVSLPTLPLPPLFFTSGWQTNTWELRLRELTTSFAIAIDQRANVRVVNEQRLGSRSPASERLSVKSDWVAGFPYQVSHAAALAESLARLIRNPLPMKGLITDLDETLWSGIVGEVGVDGVHWDLDHHAQGHGLYQQFLSGLADEGVLVGIASKNDPKIVEEVFAQREDLLLSRRSVFPLEVSWGSKAKAVARILSTWNIAADTVVFVDDNPLELAEVQALHSQIQCLQFPSGNPDALYALLVQLRDLFGKSAVSAEDEIRLESIRNSAAWRAAGENSAEGFSETLLEQAQAELTLNLHKDAGDARALELINKTNQFNLNGRRFIDKDWQQYLERPDTFVLTVSYKDRFGPLGKIAIITGCENGEGLFVESWVMSCRAFARRIEHHCLKFLFEKFASNRITFEYQETPRNNPVRMFFAEFLPEGLPPRLEISRAQFSAMCPRLFHSVRELDE